MSKMRMIPSLVLLAALAACSDGNRNADPAAQPAAQPEQKAAEPVAPAESKTVEIAETGIKDGGEALAHFVGFGDMRFGMAPPEMEKAWGGSLQEVGQDANDQCFFLVPKWAKTPAEFNFMVADGKFARYSTEDGKYVAPGGGAVGMDAEQVEVLYEGRVESQPHKYVQGGKYLKVKDDKSGNALVFETDANGVVKEWRVGQAPQVDFVEGCS